jgi:hypothetical protein
MEGVDQPLKGLQSGSDEDGIHKEQRIPENEGLLS